MNNKRYMYKFIKTIQDRKLLTEFIINLFDYDNFNDYNYIFRMTDNNNSIILDIYDNISDHRFNRYIFDFNDVKSKLDIIKQGNVFLTIMPIKNVSDDDIKLYKLAYLFKLDKNKMIEYSKTFLNKEFVDILSEIIK